MNVKSKIPIRIAMVGFVFLTVLIDAFEFACRPWRESFPGPKYAEKSGARDIYTAVTFPFRLGHDFSWRYNEVQCLKSGIDPYLVWSETCDHPRFVRYQKADDDPYGRLPVNAYPPWEYTYLLPLAMLPVSWAWTCYVLLNVVAVAYLWNFARTTFSRNFKGRMGCACFSSLAISFGAALPCVLFSGNFGLLIAAVSVAMVSALDNKNQIAAGLCWAVLMTKPQLALLLAIPLLGRRQYVAVATAIATCLLASLPPAWMCHSTPWTMIAEIPKFGGNVACHSTFIPPRIWWKLEQLGFGRTALNLTSMTVGVTLLILTCRRIGNVGGWLLQLGLAMLTGTAWTYSRTHDRCVWVVPILALGLLWNTAGDRRVRRCLSVATFALLVSLYVKYATPGVLWASALPLFPNFKLFEFVAKVHPYIELASVVTVFWAVLFFLSHGGESADDLDHVKGCQVHKQRPECRLEN